MIKCIVTTSDKPNDYQIFKAKQLAKIIPNAFFQTRDKKPLWKMQAEFLQENVIVVTKSKIVAYAGNESFFFHPSMSELRILNKEPDHMLEAMDLKEGMRVLDCTMGLGSDTIVASWKTGKSGQIVALENSPIISVLVSEGFKNYKNASLECLEAMHRIKTLCVDYREYLEKCQDKQFDIVYFDPMFENAIKKSSAINSIRPFANFKILEKETLLQACRVAKKRVVVKLRKDTRLFENNTFTYHKGGKYSKIAFGVVIV